MIIEKENIESYIPQRFPFIMIDNLIHADESGFISSFQVMEENVFSENGFLTEPALIENIAQTCAAGFGFIGQQNNEGPSIGYIGAISNLTVNQLPEYGTTIMTKIEITNSLGNIFLIKGRNTCNENLLVECEMKIALA
jgi:3-hydroxymyristoyl/3-hydroxydecanoyl-(acyl carrier protein) dehydratase